MDATDAVEALDGDLPAEIERVLADYFAGRAERARQIGADFASALDALRAFVLGGGKRIRPTFAWWGWRGAGGDPGGPDTPSVLRAISALELLQACALVHDDLMDASALRRGEPTVHVDFARRHRERGLLGEPARFGLAAAVLLGDVALAWAEDLFLGSGLPAETLLRALPPWQAMRTEMLAGQYIDVLTQARGDESVAAALRIDRFKTAAYTVERPLHIGAALAGADDELVSAYRSFGTDVGIAFQLRDDLLGVYGDPAVTGKPAGDDLREGKRTVLVALGLEHAERDGRHSDATLLRASLGRADLAVCDVDKIRELLVELGAVDAVERRITELTESALATLSAASIQPAVADRLVALTRDATSRNR